jgi:ABC-type branched-subunit amino acid transport system substrate-binding protein
VDDSYEAKAIAEYAVNKMGVRSFAVLHVNDNPAGIAVRDAFVSSVKSNGGEIASIESFSGNDKELSTPLAKVVSSSPDAIYVQSNPGQMALIINKLRSFGFEGKILAYGPSVYSEEVSSTIADKNDIYYALPADTKETSFWADYEAKTSETPDMLVALGYDSMKILEEPLLKCGESTDCMEQELLALKDYPSSRGKLNFNSEGALEKVPFDIKKLE